MPVMVAGTVHGWKPDCAAAAPAPPAAVEGATVSLRCPGAPASVVLTKTDAGGRLRIRPEKALPFECQILIEKEGYLPRSYPVEDVCSFKDQPWFVANPPPACVAVSFSAKLVATAPARRSP
jgi:hypothetical protein